MYTTLTLLACDSATEAQEQRRLARLAKQRAIMTDLQRRSMTVVSSAMLPPCLRNLKKAGASAPALQDASRSLTHRKDCSLADH